MLEKVYVKESAVVYKNTRRKIMPFKLTSKEDVYRFIRTILPPQPQENFIIIGSGTDLVVHDWSLISRGNHCTCIVDTKAVLRWALLTGCCRLITVHNHPSGNPTPSTDDMNTHEKLEKAAQLVSLELIDSLIAGDSKIVSILEVQNP